MDPISTTAAALVAGLVTSVHCAGMCGPLACSLCTLKGGESRRLLAATSYHGGRLISYTLIGALCGALGKQPLRWVFETPALVLPWILVAAFLLIAFNLHQKIPTPKLLQKITASFRKKACRLSATKGGLALGLFTPLLPCGPLYLMFAACLATGSPVKGAEFALAFGLGTIPLLWFAQHSFHKLRNILPKQFIPNTQRALAGLTALILIWRLHDTIPLNFSNEPQPAQAEEKELPSCCH